MKTKVKLRYIAALIIIVGTILATPYCIEAANEARGYEAIGGEYLIIPIGLLTAYAILEIMDAWDRYLFRQKRKKWQDYRRRIRKWEHEEENKEKRGMAYSSRKSRKKAACRQKYDANAISARAGNLKNIPKRYFKRSALWQDVP